MIYIRLTILLAALLGTMSSALAASFNEDDFVDDALAGQELDAANEEGKVGPEGIITPVNNDIGIDHTTGNDVVIEIKGKVLGTDGDGGNFVSIPIKSVDGTGVKITILKGAEVKSQDTTRFAHAIVSAGNTATIKTDGKITTVSARAHGIYSSGNDAEITQSGGEISTIGERAYGIYSRGGDAIITQSGGKITTKGDSGAHGIYSASATVTIRIAGEISTTGANSYGIHPTSVNATIIQTAGRITTEGRGSHGIASPNTATMATVTQSGGKITTKGRDSHGIFSAGATATILQSGGSITTIDEGSHGIVSRVTGNAGVEDVDHRITTTAGATIRTSGVRSHGIRINNNANMSRFSTCETNQATSVSF